MRLHVVAVEWCAAGLLVCRCLSVVVYGLVCVFPTQEAPAPASALHTRCLDYPP